MVTETREQLLEENIRRLSEDICKNLVRTKELSDRDARLKRVELLAEIYVMTVAQRDKGGATDEDVAANLKRLIDFIRGVDVE